MCSSEVQMKPVCMIIKPSYMGDHCSCYFFIENKRFNEFVSEVLSNIVVLSTEEHGQCCFLPNLKFLN